MTRTDDQQPDKNQEATIEFEDQELSGVHISDEDLEAVDSDSKNARKKAKKLSKSQLTDNDVKLLRRKKWLIGGAIVLLIILVPLIIPASRWPILNTLGIRSTMNFSVVEQEDKIPLSNVVILLDGTFFTTTDEFGKARFENTKLGNHKVSIQKKGYSREDLIVTAGITASNTAVEVKSIGIKVNLDIRNWLTNEPVAGATVALEKDTVKSDKTGRASIVVAPESDAKTRLQVSAPGYKTQSIPLSFGVESKEVALVSDIKDYFVSKRDGKYDIFASNLDGTQQQKVIEATGKEDGDLLQFTLHRGNRYGILVANREGKVVNSRVIAGIYVIDFATAGLRKIDEGSDVQLLEWADDAIVFQKTNQNVNYDDPALTKLISFNPITGKQKQVAEANYFAAAVVAQNKVFYAGADGYREGGNTPLTSIDLGSSATKTYLEGRLPNVVTRSNYDSLTVLADDNSYYNIAVQNGAVKKIDRRIDSPYAFGLNPNGAQVVWADKRDGQGALLVRSTKQDDTKVVAKLSGLAMPTRWVSDRMAVVRIVTTAETADYVIDIPTAKSAKIVDVSDVRHVGVVL